VPIAGFVLIRIVRAFAATALLFAHPRVLRSLPWPYIRHLALRSPQVRAITLTLAVSLLATMLGAAAPDPVGRTCTWIAVYVGMAGILSSGLRFLVGRSNRKS
jgi:hypothetical protein